MRRIAWLLTSFVVAGCATDAKVGPQADGSTLVATGQVLRPAGDQIATPGRPVDLALSSDKQTLFAKDNAGLVVIDVLTKKVIQKLPVKGGTSVHGIATTEQGQVWISGAGGTMSRASLKDGAYAWDKTIELPKAEMGGSAYPCGFTIANNWMLICASRDNSVYIYDIDSGEKIQRIPVDTAPYDVVVDPAVRFMYVSCWGGPKPGESDLKALSSGTQVAVDERSVAKTGTVLRIYLDSFNIANRAEVGLQPMQLIHLPSQGQLLVAHGNADHVTILDSETLATVKTIDVKPNPKVPYGSMPGAIAVSTDGKTLYTANGGDNAIGVFDLAKKTAKGFIPVGWYPGAVLLLDNTLWVANVKGIGSREPTKDANFSVYNFSGTLSAVPLPSDSQLKAFTQTVANGNAQKEALSAIERSKKKPGKPVPNKLGEQSPIEHVVYILKENRTYDQVFGDVEKGDGDKALCIFGSDVTPNMHALADEFALLDNYYCNGVNSADGHSWAMEGIVTGYLERSFGGFTRSYPYGGDDALNAASSGFLWDAVLAEGLTFQNFGEFDTAKTEPKRSWTELYAEHTSGNRTTKFPKDIEVHRMKTYSDLDFPGWNLGIPDLLRADIFIERLAKMDTMANFTIIYLPQDHTNGTAPGTPTPQAMVADNDQAVGKIVEALSHSKWWPKMAIFVIEDDAQAGFDHVDGHRSPCLVISPYVKRKQVVSAFFNQTSVLHTMSQILGVAPITKFVAESPLMGACFTETPDPTPYTCRPPIYPVDKLNPSKDKMSTFERKWAELSLQQDFTHEDRINDDVMNRILWHAVKGTERYPTELAGPHGRGLKSRGLSLGVFVRDED